VVERELKTADYDCETCHTTKGATYYDQRIGPRRLCRACFVAAGGVIETRERDSRTPASTPLPQVPLKTSLSVPISMPEISSQPDGRVTEPSQRVTILLGPDGRSRRRKYSNRADQQRAYRQRLAEKTNV
jgi:hypothetical protein